MTDAEAESGLGVSVGFDGVVLLYGVRSYGVSVRYGLLLLEFI